MQGCSAGHVYPSAMRAPRPTHRICPATRPLQVSWCKLEVEVDSHKAVTANPADNKCARGCLPSAAVPAF